MTQRRPGSVASNSVGILGWVLEVDLQNRLRFSHRIDSAVSWLPLRDEDSLTAMVGPRGGIVIAPSSVLGEHAALLERVAQEGIRFSEVTSQLTEYARFTATTWEVSLSRESTRYSLTLPEGARKLQLVPSRRGLAFLFSAGDILEVWDAHEWTEHVRQIARNVTQVRVGALDEVCPRE